MPKGSETKEGKEILNMFSGKSFMNAQSRGKLKKWLDHANPHNLRNASREAFSMQDSELSVGVEEYKRILNILKGKAEAVKEELKSRKEPEEIVKGLTESISSAEVFQVIDTAHRWVEDSLQPLASRQWSSKEQLVNHIVSDYMSDQEAIDKFKDSVGVS